MTIPAERYRAVKYAREFLRELLDPKATPKVPSAIRKRARSVLKHFPTEYDMERAAMKNKDLFHKESEEY